MVPDLHLLTFLSALRTRRSLEKQDFARVALSRNSSHGRFTQGSQQQIREEHFKYIALPEREK